MVRPAVGNRALGQLFLKYGEQPVIQRWMGRRAAERTAPTAGTPRDVTAGQLMTRPAVTVSKDARLPAQPA
ncbi:hypothetical protein GCM10010347_43140 [Streptomyces cirratus]|uniref:Uncharacterized protein n=1 Tax=Streptomyces cirratus TaxID=68187 RepID=A0ABQ3F0V2_9ACTN|nr:hypothetical protein GCM10010347_43140 [Streptomyces cirratus]